jgi:hypothetical protein
MILRALLLTVITTAIARGIVIYFKLDQAVARSLGLAFENPNRAAFGWAIAGIFGLICLLLWLIFHVDERLTDFLSPRPALGSLPIGGEPILRVNRDQAQNRTDVEMSIPLHNDNNDLIAFRCELRGTVNEKNLDAPIIFNGVVARGRSNSLILRLTDIPLTINRNFATIDARMRYNLVYWFPRSQTRTRRTSKLVQWTSTFQATGVAVGTTAQNSLNVNY